MEGKEERLVKSREESGKMQYEKIENLPASSTTADKLEHLKADIESYIGNKNKLMLIAQKFRESVPPLVAGDLLSGENMKNAIEIAFYEYPALSQKFIQDLRRSGEEKLEAVRILKQLSENLAPHIDILMRKEALQTETLRDDVTKHAANGLSKIFKEFQRHPMATLVGTAALTGAIALLWNGGNEKIKKWMKGGAIASGLIGGGGLLANMIVRSQSEKGQDLFDILGLSSEIINDKGDILDRISAMYPGLNIENDQTARDLERMLNSDCEDIYRVFNQAFRKGERSIDPYALARMGAGMDDLSLNEAKSMNGASSYKALEDFMILLARKNNREGSNMRETVSNGMDIFYEKFVNKAEGSNLNTAILMTVNQKDVSRALISTRIDLEEAILTPLETAMQARIINDFKNKGLDTWNENGKSKKTDIKLLPGLFDGERYVRINDYPWEYDYDTDRKLHTFKDPRSGISLHVGKNVQDRIGDITKKLVQQRVNDFFPGTVLNGLDTLQYDEKNHEWISKQSINTPPLPHLGLNVRERHVAIIFQAGREAPKVRIQESLDKVGTSNFQDIEMQVIKERVLEVVQNDLKYITGNLPIQIEKVWAMNPKSKQGKVDILWGLQKRKGEIIYKNQEIVKIVLLENDTKIPEELSQEWENIAENEAMRLVDENQEVEDVMFQLGAAFSGKDDIPNFPMDLDGVNDLWTYIRNLDIQSADSAWMEAIAFQRAVLHNEVKGKIMLLYSENFSDNSKNPIFNKGEWHEKLRKEVVDGIIAPRMNKLQAKARSIANSAESPGRLSESRKLNIREVKEMGMTPEYVKWIEKFENVIEGKVDSIDLDTVGIEGMKSADIIHKMILLKIMELSYPMNTSSAEFNSKEAVAWRSYFEGIFPSVMARAIKSKEGNLWIDERYNSYAFIKALEAEGVKPYKEADASSLQGFIDSNLNIPFYGSEQQSAPYSLREAQKNENTIDYMKYSGDFLRRQAIDLYSNIADIEKSFTDDEFDNFINWRLKRYIDEYNEYLNANIYPFLKNQDPATFSSYNKEIKNYVDETVQEMKKEAQNLSGYQIYLENPEGLLSSINIAGREADPDEFMQVEEELIQSMIRRNSPNRSAWQKASAEILQWIDSSYQNENLISLKNNWIRQDIAQIWMEKIDFGAFRASNTQDIEEYRKFFSNVAEGQISMFDFSSSDLTSILNRNNKSQWKKARVVMNSIPNFEEWLTLKNTAVNPSDWTREEVSALDWEHNEKLSEYRQMRSEVNRFMKEFESEIDVSKFTRLDGQWPRYFRDHAKRRLEIEILPRAENLSNLKKRLIDYKIALHIEAAFYDTIINSKIEAKAGEEVQSIATPILLASSIVGGAVLGSSIGGPLGGAPGAVIGGVTAAGAGGILGIGAGKLVNKVPLPNIGTQHGKTIHSKIEEQIDEVFQNNFLSNGKFDAQKYANDLNSKLIQIIRDAIAQDAATYDIGPITMYIPNSNIDRMQIYP